MTSHLLCNTTDVIAGNTAPAVLGEGVVLIKVEETEEQDEGSVIEKTGEEDVDGEMMESYAEEGEEAEDQYQF